MIKRENYLNTLRSLRDEHLIKVITGVRRAGKSTLLAMYRDELLQSSIPPERIISLNFEEEQNEWLLDRHTLMGYIKERLSDSEMNYIFLDEIQKVPDFEILVDALFVKPNVDLYITGSNAYMLSGELATYLSGRYVEINILPFSFKEFLQVFDDNLDLNQRFNQYLHYSAFPQAAQMVEYKPDAVNNYLRGIYESVIVKDILARKDIKNRYNLELVLKYMTDNIGNITSPNRIANILSNNNTTISTHANATTSTHTKNTPLTNTPIKGTTIENYLTALTESFVLYKTERWDTKGRKILQTLEKYYIVDLGLRRILLGRSDSSDLGHLLENVIYLELKRRGGEIYIGKVGDNQEIDFVVKTAEGDLEYYQVAYTVAEPSTLQRELAAFQAIKDNYPKTLLTLDPLSFNENGIKHINAISWLLGKVS